MNQAEFSIRTPSDSALLLTQAVLIYKGRSGGVLATLHAVEDVDGEAVIGAGKAVTPRAALDMARALGRDVGHGGFLPETVLYVDGDLLLWWLPPARRHVMFRVDAAHAEAMGGQERGETVPHPALVFAVSSKLWGVWAVKGGARPTPATPLYQAPYFNVYDNGAICQGNVQVPTGTTAEKIEAWNAAFFHSYFSHPNVQTKLVTYRGGAYRLWRDLLDGRHQRFPERALVPVNATLGTLLGLPEVA
jgi:PRTRC genetic system protein B